MSSRLALASRLAAAGLVKRRHQFALIFVTLVAAFWAALSIASILASIQRQIRDDLGRLGHDVVNIHAPLDPLEFFKHKLTVADCPEFERLGGDGAVCAPLNILPTVAKPAGAGDANGDATIDGATVLLLGTTPAWERALRTELVSGRFFREDENDACVLDEWVFKQLFPGGAPDSPALRATVGGSEKSYRIVGVFRDPFDIRSNLEEWDVTGAARSQLVRFMEYKNVYVPRTTITIGDAIVGAVLKVGAGIDPEQATERVLEYLEEKGSTAVAWARKRWANDIIEATSTLDIVSNFLCFLILGITAVMVVTIIVLVVRSRYREIAIRRVEGARRRDVALQLVLENVLLAFIASAVAVPVTMRTVRWLEENFLGWHVALTFADAAWVLGIGYVVLTAATVVPARHAAALDPVLILRHRRG